MSQTSYATNMVEGTPGLIAFSPGSANVQLTGKNPTMEIPFGQMVAKIAGADGKIGLPAASGDQMYGVSIRDTAREGSSYLANSAVGYLKRGQIYVAVEEAVTPDDAVFVRYAGKAQVQTITLSTDLIASNVVNGTVNGNALAPTTYASSHNATWAAVAALIAAQPGVLTAVASGDVITVTSEPDAPVVLSGFAVTLGSSQPTVTIAETVPLVLTSDRGKFRNDADSSTCVAVTNAKFLTSSSGAGVVILDINLP